MEEETVKYYKFLRIEEDTFKQLTELKKYPRETYNQLIKRLIRKANKKVRR